MEPFNGMDIACPWMITHATQREPRADYLKISAHRYLPIADLQEKWAAELHARSHPRRTLYLAPAAPRALAHAVERPGAIITGFSALAVFGLPFLVEGSDTTLTFPTSSTSTGGQTSPSVSRRGASPCETWTIYLKGHPFRIASPAAATIQGLKQLRSAQHAWPIVSGLDPLTTRAVQLIDCARCHLGVSTTDLLSAGHYRMSKRWLTKVLALSSSHAESPKETEMRLLTLDLARQFGFTLQEQVPVYLHNRLVTVFDLALAEPKIGLMYDGAHHWEHHQRQKDSLINLEVTTQGWTPLRFSSGTLPELPGRLRRLLRAKSDME